MRTQRIWDTTAFGPTATGGGIVLWSLLALGLWALVDPPLTGAAGMAVPVADLVVGFAGWFGLGREAAALRDAGNFGGLAGWAVGPLHFLAKATLILVWLAGAAALAAASETGGLQRKVSEHYAMWARLCNAHRGAPFAMLLHGDDQV